MQWCGGWFGVPGGFARSKAVDMKALGLRRSAAEHITHAGKQNTT